MKGNGDCMKMYEMEMEFELVVGLKSINNIMMNMYGFEDKACISGQMLTLKQTVPFVPTEAYLKEFADIIKKEYQTDELETLDCKFKGYKKFIEVEVEERTEV
jgi:hypothetical protein